jgi:hypothetical protein
VAEAAPGSWDLRTKLDVIKLERAARSPDNPGIEEIRADIQRWSRSSPSAARHPQGAGPQRGLRTSKKMYKKAPAPSPRAGLFVGGPAHGPVRATLRPA